MQEILTDRIHPLANILAISPTHAREKAAITIQKYVRGHLVRQSHLPSRLYPQYRTFCEKLKWSDPEAIMQAQDGWTTVYLPQEIPTVIFKKSGRENAITRFHQMQQVRSILNSQKSSHLIIPKANLYQEYLVEQRLPINIDPYYNMELYLSHPQLFDEAVREMTRLFSKNYFSDLLTGRFHPFTNIVGDAVRYDNLPLYIEEENGKKTGKLGLIDLETFQSCRHPNGLPTLARIFPLHVDIIKQEASLLKVVFHENSLKTSADKGIKYLTLFIKDHLEWLQKKGVSKHTASHSFQISKQREEILSQLVMMELLKLNQGINQIFTMKGYVGTPQKDFFTENPEPIAQELAVSISSLIISNLTALIEKKQNKKLSALAHKDMTETELLSLRSPLIRHSKIQKGVGGLISRHPKVDFKTPSEPNVMAEQLSYVILKELVNGGELFYFDPAYNAGGFDRCWIRY